MGTEPSLWRESAGGRLVLAIVLSLWARHALADENTALAKPRPNAPFVWRSTWASAFEAASSRSRPVLVYCPAVSPSKDPPVLSLAPKALGVPPMAEGVRVGAGEILEVLERFKVRELPALLLLDRRENVLLRWEGGIPLNCWSALEGAIRRLDRKDEEDARSLRDARKLEASGDLEGAYRKAAPFLASERTSPENLQEAGEVERSLLSARRRDLLRLLAEEGILPDSTVAAKLESLRAVTSHPGFRAAVADEIRRLERGAIGGKTRGY